MEISELTTILQRHKVETKAFGRGKVKSLDELVNEINEGETILSLTNAGQLQRNIRTLEIDVKHRASIGKVLVLREASRIGHDGRDLSRRQSHSMSEKLKAGEEANQDSLARAIKEELGIIDSDSYTIGKQKPPKIITRISPSCPGLLTSNEIHQFTVWLDKKVFRPEGYIEDDGKKVTEFKWKRQLLPF